MKISLIGINAKYIHSNPAIYSLRSCVKDYRNMVDLQEYTINQRREEIRQEIYAGRPDVLAFSCYIWNITLIEELLWDLHKILPEAEFWLGGPEVSHNPEEVLGRLPMVKGILVGEGEVSFPALVSFYGKEHHKNADNHIYLKEIPGIYTREFVTPCPPPCELGDIPFWYDEAGTGKLSGEFENRILYYESSRGCPFSCSYCLSSVEKSLRFRPLDMVKKELDFFLDNKVPQVKFIDRTFNCKKQRSLAIWQYLKEKDNGITNFHFEIAADLLSEEELECLSTLRPGQVQLEIGVQTTNACTLKEIRRITDMDRLSRNIARLRSFGNMHLHLDLIAGLPFEDMDSFIRSFNEVYAMGGDDLQLGFLKVLHGSFMEEQKHTYGILHEEKAPYEVLSTNWISYEDVVRLKQVEEMVELYANSGQFGITMGALEKEFESPFAMFDALAAFYKKEGYFTNAPARSRRYEVLLAFVEHIFPDKKEAYRMKLTLDFYLREKPKSRPAFALPEDRGLMRAFLDKEEREAYYLQGREGLTRAQIAAGIHLEPVSESVILFMDYAKRNPLNHNAECTEVPVSYLRG